MEPRPSIPLSRATLCLNCDRIYENGRRERAGDCPKCNSTHGLGLARIVRPLHEAQTPVVRVEEGGSRYGFDKHGEPIG